MHACHSPSTHTYTVERCESEACVLTRAVHTTPIAMSALDALARIAEPMGEASSAYAITAAPGTYVMTKAHAATVPTLHRRRRTSA